MERRRILTLADADTAVTRQGWPRGHGLAAYESADATDEAAIDRERGYLEAIAHLSRHGGLTHAGQAEARQMVAASEEWFADLTGDGPVR